MASSLARSRLVVIGALASLCGLAIWLIVALLALGALERNVTGTVFIGNSDDLVGYLMAALFALGLALALADGGHVRVDILYRLYAPRVRMVADLAFKGVGVVAASGLTAAGLALVYDSLSRGRIDYGLVDMPLWIPQLLLPLGTLLFMLEFLVGEPK